MSEVLSAVMLVCGAAFMLLASVGLVRFPDLFSRMQAATKASMLGIASLMVAVAFHFQNLGVTARALLVIGLILLTAPVAAHLIARAAYLKGVPLWEGTVIDELRDRYEGAASPAADDQPAGGPPPPDSSGRKE